MNRRELLAFGAASIAVAQAGKAFAQTVPAKVVPEAETRSLDELHKAALAEGGDLIVYAGGDIPQWIRGTVPARLVVERGEKAATFTASGPLVTQPNSPIRFLLPRSDDFLAWPQTAALFKAARHPTAAKLYLSWLLSREMQQGRWSVRRDLPPPARADRRQIANALGIEQAAVVEPQLAGLGPGLDHGAPVGAAADEGAAALEAGPAHDGGPILDRELEAHGWTSNVEPHVDIARAAGVLIGRERLALGAACRAAHGPHKIIAVHISYSSRSMETRNRPKPTDTPTYFTKPPSSLNGHRGQILKPADCP